ncbi:hypothetical protein [Streptomyces sp. TLI_185]|uniref:hypothetical protein n=1 Tax=Streptomyces sp. TLI_185 TaxID=2485151 RepID=UPI000F4EA117|nr:hypothetical protein [Streptomyces sp. TLI_185]
MEHPDEDELTALALGTLPGVPAELLRHLTVCATCRTAYDDLSAAVDAVLPAAPAVAAPPGFDARVLDHLELRRPSPARLRRRTPLVVAAAAAAGLCLGTAGTALLHHESAPVQVTASDHGGLLLTGSGRGWAPSNRAGPGTSTSWSCRSRPAGPAPTTPAGSSSRTAPPVPPASGGCRRPAGPPGSRTGRPARSTASIW